jgi:hypothetical protein
MIKDYLRTAPDADYIRLASSYLKGGPKSLWTSVYEAYKAAHGLTLVSYSVRRLRRIMDSRIRTRSSGTPGTV